MSWAGTLQKNWPGKFWMYLQCTNPVHHPLPPVCSTCQILADYTSLSTLLLCPCDSPFSKAGRQKILRIMSETLWSPCLWSWYPEFQGPWMPVCYGCYLVLCRHCCHSCWGPGQYYQCCCCLEHTVIEYRPSTYYTKITGLRKCATWVATNASSLHRVF